MLRPEDGRSSADDAFFVQLLLQRGATTLSFQNAAKPKQKLQMRRLRQPDDVVVEQPPAGMRLSDESEERTNRQRRGNAAVPSIEVRHESIQVESRKRAADAAIEDVDPRMQGYEEIVDDDVTIAAGQVSAGHGDDPMGVGTDSEGQVAVDALQRGGPVPVEDLFEYDMRGVRFGMM